MKGMNRRQFILAGGAIAAAPVVSSCRGRGREFTIPKGVPLSGFDADSTAEEVSAGIGLSGRTALVTGCNSGLGYETMRVLAMRGAHVIGTGRTIEKARDACASVEGTTTPVALELSDFESVVNCAETVKALGLPIDMLICNAGYIGGSEQRKAYDLDLAFVVNHLGHFILVNRLLDRVRAADQGRVVMVSSFAALRQPVVEIQFDNLAFDGNYDPLRSYAHSKLANALFSLELSKRLQSTNVTANALHPGVIKTNITRNLSGIARWAFGLYADLLHKSVEQGAATTVYLATNPALASVSGYFFHDCNPVIVNAPPNHLYNDEMATRLWQVSMELTRPYL